MLKSITKPLSGVFLIMGTAIGAGMLALPIVTGLSGFYPAVAVNFLCCLFMIATGLLLLEGILWLEDGVNVLSIARVFLGNEGRFLAGASFLGLYYCLEVSYCAGGAPIFALVIRQITGIAPTGVMSYLAFVLFFGFLLFLGTKVVDKVNWLLMAGLLISFLLLITVGSREINAQLLRRTDWPTSFASMPVLFGAYGYHNILPSLATYLKRNIRYLRFAVIVGSLITFSIYSLWQWMIIGTLTLNDISGADLRGEPVTQTLQKIVGHPWLVIFGEYFGFFALVTSFLGVSLSMVDFLADGFQVQRNAAWPRLILCSIVLLPPALFASANPGIFISALGVAGGYGEAILNGLLPIGIVWMGRYYQQRSSQYSLAGGRTMLVALILFTVIIMGIETRNLIYG